MITIEDKLPDHVEEAIEAEMEKPLTCVESAGFLQYSQKASLRFKWHIAYFVQK